MELTNYHTDVRLNTPLQHKHLTKDSFNLRRATRVADLSPHGPTYFKRGMDFSHTAEAATSAWVS